MNRALNAKDLKPRKMHPNSMGNLAKPFVKGESGPGKGRPRGSVYPMEAMKSCSDMTRDELQTLKDDDDANVVLRAAARQYLTALNSTNDDQAGKSLDRLADRLEGKAKQTHTVEVDTDPIKDFQVGETAPPQLETQQDVTLIDGVGEGGGIGQTRES